LAIKQSTSEKPAGILTGKLGCLYVDGFKLALQRLTSLSNLRKQETQLSHTDRAMLRVIGYFAKPLISLEMTTAVGPY